MERIQLDACGLIHDYRRKSEHGRQVRLLQYHVLAGVRQSETWNPANGRWSRTATHASSACKHGSVATLSDSLGRDEWQVMLEAWSDEAPSQRL